VEVPATPAGAMDPGSLEHLRADGPPASTIVCAQAGNVNTVHATAMAYTGQVADREYGGGDHAPESSRRARGFATWAALRALGHDGVRDLVDRCRAAATDPIDTEQDC
jgi:glutamate/tyrosine decarboxylase-like PLP-dependent enzyme